MGHKKGSGRSTVITKIVNQSRAHPKFSVSSSLENYGVHKFATWGSAVSFLETTVDHAYQDVMYDHFKAKGRTQWLANMERERKEIISSISSMRTYKGDVYIFINGVGYWTRLL